MAKKHKGSGHDDIHADERWLVTYADMITLLLAVFIVMYALSDTNLRKFNAFAQSLSAAFNTDVMSGSTQFTVTEGQATTPDTGQSQAALGYIGASAQTLQTQVENAAIEAGMGSDVSVSLVSNGASIQIRGSILFEPGRATLVPESSALMQKVATLVVAGLKGAPTAFVRVEGNTDSNPVTGPLYADNWELSAARALTVLHFLRDNGVDASRLVMGGNGSNMPLPSTQPQDAVNRRVQIVIWVPDTSPTPTPTPAFQSIGPSFNPVFGG